MLRSLWALDAMFGGDRAAAEKVRTCPRPQCVVRSCASLRPTCVGRNVPGVCAIICVSASVCECGRPVTTSYSCALSAERA